MENISPRRFISDSPIKTAATSWEIITEEKKYLFEAPPGFQYDRYFQALYPNTTISYKYDDGKLCINVFKEKFLIASAIGFYKKEN
jgi:hypothetical protein